MVQEKIGLLASLSALTDNAFKQQKRNAYYASAKAATETAFAELNLKQCNSGYKSVSRQISSES